MFFYQDPTQINNNYDFKFYLYIINFFILEFQLSYIIFIK